jgi:HTH-type transcriptional regulator/antitoxin HigA
MGVIANKYHPDYVIHPGEYLEEILGVREIKKRDFAERCGLSVKAVSQIINRKSLYSPEVALQFEKTLDVSADIWMNMANSYQLFNAREKEKKRLESEITKQWVKSFPLADLKKLGILPDTIKIQILAERILKFFNVASTDVWNDYYKQIAASYRKSKNFKESPEATACWLRFAELQAERIECKPFNKANFQKAIKEIRKFTTMQPDVFGKKMQDKCAQSGVALVFIPELKSTHISGATRWLTSGKAMIALSLRYKSNDHFWFTFYHEAAHILLHGKKDIFIDSKDSISEGNEKEADDFAANILIPQKKYRDFVKYNQFDKQNIMLFAKKLGLAPGIIIGRLQHDKFIDFSWHNDLKERYEIVIIKEDE